MRKVLFLAVLLAVVFCFTGITYASVDQIYEAAVISLKGDVKVDTKAEGIWIAPWVGMKLMKGALVKTGANSSAEIVFDAEGMNVLLVKPNTQIIVDKSSINLAGGSVLARFENLSPGSSFTVKTPNATCGIRGSGLGVDFINGLIHVSGRNLDQQCTEPVGIGSHQQNDRFDLESQRHMMEIFDHTDHVPLKPEYLKPFAYGRVSISDESRQGFVDHESRGRIRRKFR